MKHLSRAFDVIAWRLRLIVVFNLVSPLAYADLAPADLAGRVHDLFVARCSECHAPAPKGRGEDPTYLTDFSELAKDGSIVNLAKPEDSRLYKFVKNGKMPKSEPDKGQVRAKLSEAEVQVVLEWIKAGAPTPAAPAPIANAPKFISEEHVIELIAQDLRKNVAEFDQPRTRYLSLVNLHNARINDPAGDSADDIELYRQAVSKMVNSLSWEEKIVVPAAIDPDKLIFRIHLPDYGWTTDLWKEAEDFYPYDIDRHLNAGEAVLKMTGATHPFMRADWFVFAVSQPPLYHDFLQLPRTDRELETQRLHIDAARNISDGRVVRAGLSKSGVSDQNRLVERHPMPGGYWKSYDFKSFAQTEDPHVILRDHPLGPGNETLDFRHAGGELIFALPNGLHGYMLVGSAGARIDTGPTDIVRDPGMKPASIIINGVSCMSCHTEGMKPLADDIGGKWLGRDDLLPTDKGLIQKFYGRPNDLAAGLKEDEERYLKALASAGVTRKDLEPVRALFERFRRPVKFGQAASEVSLPLDEFSKRIEAVPQLKTLRDDFHAGGVPRDQFIAFFDRINLYMEVGGRVDFKPLDVPAFGAKAELAEFRKILDAGYQYVEQQGAEKAIKDYTRLIELPGVPADLVGTALIIRGKVFEDQSQLARGIADYSRAIELPGAPADIVAMALMRRGDTFTAKEPEKAIADFTSAIALSEATRELVAKAFLARANIYHGQNKATEAIDDYTSVINMISVSGESVATALIGRGATFAGQNKHAQAIRDLTSAIEIRDATPEQVARALIWRGASYYQQKDMQKAAADFKRIADLPGAPADVRETAQNALRQMNQ